MDEEEARFYNDLYDANARKNESRRREEDEALASFKESIATKARAASSDLINTPSSEHVPPQHPPLRIGSVDKSNSYSELSKLQAQGTD